MNAIIVGAGASGFLHALSLRASGVAIEGVYDIDAARAAALASVCGARVLGSLSEAVEAKSTIAAICSPPHVHVAQAEQVGRDGRLVLVEKPVATSLADLKRAARLPRCVPIVQWRAGRGLHVLRRAIAHGELGAAPIVSIDLAWARDEEYLAARAGWGCGALLSVGIHAIDAVSWALASPIVGASGLMLSRSAGHETSAAALFRFARGGFASVRISFDGAADTTRIVACGNGVTAILEGGEADPTANEIRWEAPQDRRAALQAITVTGGTGAPLLVPYLRGVVDALRDGESPGDSERMPSITSTEPAHAAILAIYAASPQMPTAARSDVRVSQRPFRESTSACAAARRAIVTRNGEHDT